MTPTNEALSHADLVAKRSRNFFRTMLTEDDDDRVWNPVRVLWFITVCLFLLFEIWSVFARGEKFNAAEFCGGVVALMGVNGISAWLFGKSGN